MADTTEVAGKAAAIPTREELDRVERFTREPFAPDPDALRPGTARRRALDAALAEIEAGREEPSIEWRQQYSLMLGLERLLADDEPRLADGTVLSAHQVDALSGTLTALIAEIERQNGNGNGALQAYEDEEEEEDDDDDEFEGVDDDDEDDDFERRGRGRGRGGRRARARGLAGVLGVERQPATSRRTSFPSSPRTPAPPAASGSSTPRAPARPSPRSASWRDRAPAAR